MRNSTPAAAEVHRRAASIAWVAVVLGGLMLAGGVACGVAAGGVSTPLTARTEVQPSRSMTAPPTAMTSRVGSSATGPAITAPALAALQSAIDRFNATAGGPVSAQQSVLAGLVAAGQSSVQRACPPVTITITMSPVYARLATSAGWHPSKGSLPGTVYAVPALIRIYTGDRITGTDLTDLHLAIDGGRLTLPAICLG